MNLQYFKPDKKTISKEKLYKLMLEEAIAIIILETDAKSYASVRQKIRSTVMKRIMNKNE